MHLLVLVKTFPAFPLRKEATGVPRQTGLWKDRKRYLYDGGGKETILWNPNCCSMLLAINISELYIYLDYCDLCWKIWITILSTGLEKNNTIFFLINLWKNVSREIVLFITENKTYSILVKFEYCSKSNFKTKSLFQQATYTTLFKIFYTHDTWNTKLLSSM